MPSTSRMVSPGLMPGVESGSALEHVHDQQAAGLVELQLDAETDEVAIDHGVEVVEAVGAQVGAVLVEGIAGAIDEFEDDGRGGDAGGSFRD